MVRPTKIISDFDVCLGRVVKSKRVKASHTRASLSLATGIPEANLKRREEGKNEITVSELERIADVVDVPALEIVEEALKDYGGLPKLIDEFTKTSDAAANVSTEDNITYIGHVAAPLDAAADDDPRTPSKD